MPPIERVFEQHAEGGGELLVCPICVTSRGLDGTVFVANARVAGATEPRPVRRGRPLDTPRPRMAHDRRLGLGDDAECVWAYRGAEVRDRSR